MAHRWESQDDQMEIVIHGGIDGHSRTIVYLRCATDNTATVPSAFRSAVKQFGLAQRVRSDQGGENTEVWRFICEAHEDPSAAVVGSSTHNERIERLWRDVYCCVSAHYCEMFYIYTTWNHITN